MSVESGRSKKLSFFDLPPSTDIFEKKAKNIKQVTHKYPWIYMYLYPLRSKLKELLPKNENHANQFIKYSPFSGFTVSP